MAVNPICPNCHRFGGVVYKIRKAELKMWLRCKHCGTEYTNPIVLLGHDNSDIEDIG